MRNLFYYNKCKTLLVNCTGIILIILFTNCTGIITIDFERAFVLLLNKIMKVVKSKTLMKNYKGVLEHV